MATRAAQAAGEVLRAEFHHFEGPRGPHGKAPADTEAERLIRARLLEAFPAWGFRGEETGEQPAAETEPHLWLADPNDGTTSFQRGRRGPAVSIALLRGAVPVLGVVFAFAAPDDEGDLFTWAEGCGPLRRNAKEVQREAWPKELGPLDVVLLSQGADRKAAVNLNCVAPARFRAMPSIACRLALVAAGEGAACVSLNSPGDWDYAAGHALLRAVGGVVLDESGEEVRYPLHDRSRTRWCFAGGREVAASLARRDWQSVLETPYSKKQYYDLARLSRTDHIRDAGLLRRAQGCLLGQLAGDALGSMVEFSSAAMIATQYPQGVQEMADGGFWRTLAGQPTDDSELALILARAIVREGGYSAEAAARAYTFWFASQPFDAGKTISHALSAISAEAVHETRAAPAAREAADAASQSNGSLMRASPLGIWGHALPADRLARASRSDSALTHPHPVCQDACAVYVVSIAHALRTGCGPRELYEFAVDWAKSSGVDINVRLALLDAAQRAPQVNELSIGWVLHAFRNAYYQLLHAESLAEGVVQTVGAGGDTDTNAAIAGALLGAVHGRDAIPAQWRRMVLSCRPLGPHVRHPRPEAFWPCDALELAELLLCAGRRARE